MSAFIMQFAVPAPPDPELSTTITFDPERQLNVLPDGTPACQDHDWLLATGSTTSTAGSKTHWDD